MTFNKAKAMRNAEKYLTQGKIQSAIGEYRQLVDHDPKDINSQNMLGDLYSKVNDTKEAVVCYQKVADFYNSQGFAKKAIAVYNKIHRINPDSIDVSSKLAELYRMRGSYAEARVHYETLASYYEGKGQRIEALAMWESIAELDPRNAEIYLKIAESYWNDSREADASDAFIKAGKRLVENKNHEGAVTAFSRALEIKPLDFGAMEGLVHSQITLGYPEDAAKTLEQRIESDPYDKDTNFLLVECYYDMGNPLAAENIIVKMVERDPSNYTKFLELIAVYLKEDDLNSTARVMSMITEHMLVGGKHEELFALIEEVLARNPEHIAALRLLARYHSWLKEETELKSALERVAESAKLNGAEEDEFFALSQLSVLVPHDTAIAARLEVLSATNDFDSMDQISLAEAPSAPEIESYAVLSDDADTSANGFAIVEGAVEQDPAEAEEYSEKKEEFNDSTEIAEVETLEAEIVEDSVEDSNTYVTDQNVEAEAVESNPVESEFDDSKEEFSDEVGGAASAEQPESDLSPSDEMKLEEESESIRFYIEQGYKGLAEKSLSAIERAYGYRPEIMALRELLGGEPNLPAATGESEAIEETHEKASEITDAVAQINESPESAADLSEQFEDNQTPDSAIEFNEDQAAAIEYAEATQTEEPGDNQFEYSESIETSEFEVNANELEAAPEMPLDESLSEFSENTGGNIAEQPSGFEDESAVNSVFGQINEEQADRSNSYENFRDDLGFDESEPVENDEFENHYHHAVAYQEMGLMEEAIREFQNAVNTVAPDDGSRRFLNCCTLLGHCFVEMGMPQIAATWIERAFEATDLNSEELNGLHYELGNALESAGDNEVALVEFEKIYAVDVGYRDVGERIERLRYLVPTTA